MSRLRNSQSSSFKSLKPRQRRIDQEFHFIVVCFSKELALDSIHGICEASDSEPSDTNLSAWMQSIGLFWRSRLVTTGNAMIGKRVCKTHFWAVDECINSVNLDSACFREAHGVVFVYSSTRMETFRHVQSRFADVSKLKGTESKVFLLVGNSLDISQHKTVSSVAARSFATDHSMGFVELVEPQNYEHHLSMRRLEEDVFKQLSKALMKKNPLQPKKTQTDSGSGSSGLGEFFSKMMQSADGSVDLCDDADEQESCEAWEKLMAEGELPRNSELHSAPVEEESLGKLEEIAEQKQESLEPLDMSSPAESSKGSSTPPLSSRFESSFGRLFSKLSKSPLGN